MTLTHITIKIGTVALMKEEKLGKHEKPEKPEKPEKSEKPENIETLEMLEMLGGTEKCYF